MAAPSAEVAAAVVTYGDRAHLCAQAVRGALAAGASSAVVIDNASGPASAAALRALETDPRVRVVRLAGNTGSAGGFRRALEETAGAQFVWLLDDDSVIAGDALTALLDEHRRRATGDHRVALFSHRTGNAFQNASLAKGRSALPRPGSFMYFDLRDRLRGDRPSRLEGAADEQVADAQSVRVLYGPYGGLLVRRADVTDDLLPHAALYLYEDDTDFTARLAAAGIELRLVARSRISDADEKWSETADRRSGPARLLTSPHAERMFYAVRNRVRFDTRAASRPAARVWLVVNAFVFLAFTAAAAVRHRSGARFRLLLTACARGIRDDLRARVPDRARR